MAAKSDEIQNAVLGFFHYPCSGILTVESIANRDIIDILRRDC